jgi:hypothetical protein
MITSGRRYSFPALERRGVILGLGPAQLSVFGAAALLAVIVLRALPTVTGLLLAGTVIGAAGACGCWLVSGRPPSAWLPVVLGWTWRRLIWSGRSDAPTRGALVSSPRASISPPPVMAGIRLIEAPPVPAEEPLGVVQDTRVGTFAAALSVHGRSFSLLDPSDKERRLSAWAAVLAGLCREGNPIYRLQWIERTVPANRLGLRRYLDEAASPATGSCRASYEELVNRTGPVGQHHQVLIVVAVRPRLASWMGRSRSGRHLYRDRSAAACALLRRELRLLRGQLDAADVTIDGGLTAVDLAGAIRRAVDPDSVRGGAVSEPVEPTSPWPLAVDEGWSAYRSDGAWHATYWIAEWPRIEVGPDFLSPLLLGGNARRAISVVMAPVGPAEAARQVEAARTADAADEQLRRRAGFLATARRRQQAEGVMRRESELAEGHGEFRFSGYVTVTVSERGELDDACAEVEQCARQANLELRRLYGQQQAAFTWTLPLARGLS